MSQREKRAPAPAGSTLAANALRADSTTSSRAPPSIRKDSRHPIAPTTPRPPPNGREGAMTAADTLGFVLAGVARLITGAQGHWKGVPPKAEQRIYFANHQSHLDWVLIWAVMPADLRAQTRPIAAADYWTTTPLKHWITREVFRAVYVDRERKEGSDPLAPLVAALEQGDSLVIFPEGTRSAKG